MTLRDKLVLGAGIALATSAFLFVNWLWDQLIALVFGHILSKLILVAGYYFLIRTIIQWFAFPGSSWWNRRHLEFSYG